jgi:hypothetical protein
LKECSCGFGGIKHTPFNFFQNGKQQNHEKSSIGAVFTATNTRCHDVRG